VQRFLQSGEIAFDLIERARPQLGPLQFQIAINDGAQGGQGFALLQLLHLRVFVGRQFADDLLGPFKLARGTPFDAQASTTFPIDAKAPA
jgi:hypothetical protein